MDKTPFCLRSFCKDNALKIFGICTFALTLICAALAAFSRTLFFDDIGYYQSDAIVPKIFFVLSACFVLFTAVFCFIPKIRINPNEQSYPLPTRIGAIVLGLGFVTLATESLNVLLEVVSDNAIVWDLSAFTHLILPLALQVLAAVHFLRVGIVKDSTGIFNVVGTIAFILYALASIASTYFNTLIPMNSPAMILLHLALLSSMLLCANEARVGLGADRKEFHAFSAALSTYFCAAFCFSEAFAYIGLLNDPRADQGALTINAYFPIVFSVFVFSATRLACICFMKPYKENISDDRAENPSEEQSEEQTDAHISQADDQQLSDAENSSEVGTETKQNVTE